MARKYATVQDRPRIHENPSGGRYILPLAAGCCGFQLLADILSDQGVFVYKSQVIRGDILEIDAALNALPDLTKDLALN